MTSLKKQVMKRLEGVMDPELFISIADLGLIYDIVCKEGDVFIKMTLTTIGCPLFPTIEKEVKEKVGAIEGVKNVHVELVFDPPWSMDRLSARARAMMGI
ncbi:MAG TPA: iron-sulfur cluster assembly protein [Patescibacteria group bacterium]|nr:iron-sulfur cluster assembly protein [Patescibacteria group bacterium]